MSLLREPDAAKPHVRFDERGVEIAEALGRLEKDVELVLFRVLQESLTNVHRHSGSKTVAIRIGADSQHVWLEVGDRGKGSANGFVRPGLGITGMRERVENLAGDLQISSDQNGTSVRVVLPLASAARSARCGRAIIVISRMTSTSDVTARLCSLLLIDRLLFAYTPDRAVKTDYMVGAVEKPMSRSDHCALSATSD